MHSRILVNTTQNQGGPTRAFLITALKIYLNTYTLNSAQLKPTQVGLITTKQNLGACFFKVTY